ncbi:helix-turn-helix domain-containing protein [Microvirga aerilata]|uniref:Helix-turn-helix domain-containing protein n=1 Tax=Microvirga aerilata TaxID=670292 RepID=A0A936ZG51_9HYPH|nr:helix-turn-helix domain-containing protein [Microvirga aerilata]MBL0405215.1 helix-turn-helix domain-containing protein [Microvirga aerilata]
MAVRAIPSYALYGENSQNPDADWIHCETIQARSRLHNYRIQPHRHETLFQILHLTGGAAEIELDGQVSTLTGPAVITLPSLTVHGYRFSPAIEGTVVTLFESRLAQILGSMHGIKDAFRSPQRISLRDHEEAARAVAADIGALAAEFSGRAQGRLEAIEARLGLIFIALHRLQAPEAGASHPQASRALQHAMRFRELVDQDFRAHKPIDAYARRLGITSPHLNRICREHLGDTALGVIHGRIILEAKRYLTFTSMSAKEVALALSFDDPAYFARFFKQKTGLSPLRFRATQKNPAA